MIQTLLDALRWLFYELPDFASLFLAAVGVAVIFLPHLLKKLEHYKTTSKIIAFVIVAIGVGAVISSSAQKTEDKRVAQDALNRVIGEVTGGDSFCYLVVDANSAPNSHPKLTFVH